MSYPARMVMRARALREIVEGEPLYSLRAAADILAREFPDHPRPHERTVQGWTNPQWMQWKLEQNQRHRAEQSEGRIGSVRHSIDRQEARCRAFITRGLPVAQVVLVMDFDYPDMGWTGARVRRISDAEPTRRTPLEETIHLYRMGLSAEEVGDLIGLTGSAVLARLRQAGVPRRPAAPRRRRAVAA